MASFPEVIRLIRGADTAERARQLQILRDTFVPPDVPDPQLQGLLDEIRGSNPDMRRQLLDEMIEQYIEDNPDPDKPKGNRKDRGKRNLLAILRTERNAGRPRPSRQVIEDNIRREERISQRELDADLVDDYDELVALELVPPRA